MAPKETQHATYTKDEMGELIQLVIDSGDYEIPHFLAENSDHPNGKAWTKGQVETQWMLSMHGCLPGKD
jgi:hypothetical protein